MIQRAYTGKVYLVKAAEPYMLDMETQKYISRETNNIF